MRKWEAITIIALLCVILAVVTLIIGAYRAEREMDQREQRFLTHAEDFVRPYQKRLGKLCFFGSQSDSTSKFGLRLFRLCASLPNSSGYPSFINRVTNRLVL